MIKTPHESIENRNAGCCWTLDGKKLEATACKAKMWLLRPNSDVNYKWITCIYAIGSLVSVVLFFQEKLASRPQTERIASLNGLYVVFAGYFFCLLWTAAILSRSSLQQTQKQPLQEKKNR
jgi:hypothetical protein